MGEGAGRQHKSGAMMQQCVNKEESQLLCKAVQARVEDGDTHEEWQDNEGRPLRAVRWWNTQAVTGGRQDGVHGTCMGIRVNLCERAKARMHFKFGALSGGRRREWLRRSEARGHFAWGCWQTGKIQHYFPSTCQ